MIYPYELTDSPNTGIALWVLERHEWNWRTLEGSSHAFIQRSKISAKTVALVAHDRILNDEIISRGLPSFYGYKGAGPDGR